MSEHAWGQHLKDWRRRRDWTQAELAQHTGYSVSTIRKLESGVLRPSREVAQRLIDVLQIPGPEQASFFHHARRLPAPGSNGGSTTASSPDGPGVVSNQFPQPLTPLIGREGDVQTAIQTLLMPTVRLMTLTGTGGVGKTRLSIAITTALGPHFADGSVFVPLVDVHDPDLVARTIGQRLGLPPVSRQDPLERLTSYLRDKQMLIVLDNCEHLGGVAKVVTAILATTPAVKVLATSRTLLHLAGEWVQAVPPLTVPPQDAPPSLSMLQVYPATALFIRRIWARWPAFELPSEQCAAVMATCQLLDGLPLAIELAAAQVGPFRPSELLVPVTERPCVT